MTSTAVVRGGRGARERIMQAAGELFYANGITTTGVEQLAETAHVSTLYQHFASKDDLVVAYLQAITLEQLGPAWAQLTRTELSPRDRILGIFTAANGLRGCPYLNAGAELCDPAHPGRQVAAASKQRFIDLLISIAEEAGARDSTSLGHQLALLSDGARAQAATLDSDEPFAHARATAAALFDAAVS
jgi:AcrR family transcriptional regulator